MHDAVWIVRQSVDDALLRLVHLEDVVFRCLEGLGAQSFVQTQNICLAVAVMDTYTVALLLPFAGLLVCKQKVIQRDNLFVKVPYTFHLLPLCRAYNRTVFLLLCLHNRGVRFPY